MRRSTTSTETSPHGAAGAPDRRHVAALATRRAARPGDVLVLVRQRGALFEAIIRALKDAGIPVAGADRLMLTEHIAVMDLMVLADALLLPEDDLALATVLKSPLFGFDDDDLFKLAWDRKGSAARGAARAAAATLAGGAARPLRAMRRAAQTPFAFYARPARRRRRPPRSSWRGSATKPPTRSTNSSTSRSTTSAARRRRCKASSPGCAPRRPRSSATWRSRATRCG